MSIRLYVGNLPKDLERQELESVFADFEPSVSTKIITDRKTGKCRGFGFVTVKTDEEADQLIEKFNGYQIKDTAIKIEKALPRTKGEEESAPRPVAATSAPAPSGNRRKGGNGNSGTNNKANKRSTTSSDPEAVQPDPRWAQDLEKLKQLLAAQAANS